jgi:hypothetical protein
VDDPVEFTGDINEKEGILFLIPGETFTTVYSITPAAQGTKEAASRHRGTHCKSST